MSSEEISNFKITFLQLIVLSLKVYWPTVTTTTLFFIEYYLELIDPLTLSAVYLYKDKTIYKTEENQITTQIAIRRIPEGPVLLHFSL